MATTILLWTIFILLIAGAFTAYHQNIERWLDTLPHRNQGVVTKQTLFERGMTLEDASDEFYDALALNKIQASHRKEHELWLKQVSSGVWNDDERKLVGLPKKRDLDDSWVDFDDEDEETISDWQGNYLRTDSRSKKCKHKINEVCIRCDR